MAPEAKLKSKAIQAPLGQLGGGCAGTRLQLEEEVAAKARQDVFPQVDAPREASTQSTQLLKIYNLCVRRAISIPAKIIITTVCPRTGATHRNVEDFYYAFGEPAGTHLKPLTMPARNRQSCLRGHSPVIDLSAGPAPQGPQENRYAL